MSDSTSPFVPYATSALVGRQQLLADIRHKALNTTGSSSIVFLTAEGGYGKTRFLQAVLEDLRGDTDIVVPNELIDLYHIQHHTVESFVNAIVETMPTRKQFRGYAAAKRKLDRLRLAEARTSIREQQQAMIETFVDEMSQLAANGRVVLALDTAERIVYSPFDAQDATAEVADIWPWLIDKLPQWTNVLLLVAGRPEISALYTDLADEPRWTKEKIKPFTPAESVAYFNAVVALLEERGLKELADKIADLDDAKRKELHEQADGRPISLSLAIDLRLTEGVETEAIPKQIVTRLLKIGDIGDTILALGRVPMGATPELLGKLLGTSEDEAQQRLEVVRRFSFVKTRPEDERIFLHDVMYEWLEESIFAKPDDIPVKQEVSPLIRAYYSSQRHELRRKINDLFMPVESGRAQGVKRDRLSELMMRRRRLLVEDLYYRLRADPERGLRQYYRYTREAIYAGDTLLDRELFLVLLEFFHVQQTFGLERLNEQNLPQIQGISWVRPVSRAFAEGDYALTIAESQQMKKNHAALLNQADHLATRAMLSNWEAVAHTYLGHSMEARGLLDTSIDALRAELEAELTSDYVGGGDGDQQLSFARWRLLAALALTYRVRGYLFRTQSNFKQAIEDYRVAIKLWTQVNIKVEEAATRNDLGFALAQRKEWEDASALIQEGLRLRRELGSRADVGLSLNTLALVLLAEGHYTEAERYATRALALFRALDSRRGTGLALVAVAEITRRGVRADPWSDPETKINRLREALALADEAIAIFEETGEVERLYKANIEAGCALRDWIWLRKNVAHPNPRDSLKRLYDQARAYLNTAVVKARKNHNLEWQLDAQINLAWLAYVYGDGEECDRLLEEIGQEMPAGYLIQKGGGAPSARGCPEEENIAMWPRIGKYYFLRGHRALDLQLASGEEWNRDANREDLKNAAEFYTLSLEYNHYLKDSPELRMATTELNNRFKKLDHDEREAFKRSILDTEKKYALAELYPDTGICGSYLRHILIKRVRW